MENKVDGLALVLDNILNTKKNTALLWMLNIVYTNSPGNKLTTLDDLLSWRTKFLQFVLTVKNDDVLQNSKWVDYVSKYGVTKEMITRPEFYLSWIVKDTEYEHVLNNWAKNCKVEDIELDKFNLSKENSDDSFYDKNEYNSQKVELGLSNNFIKICKVIDRLIVNTSLQWQRDQINDGGNKGLLNCVFGNKSYKNFFEAIAKIKGIKEYFDNIDKISCENKEFQNLQQRLKEVKVKLTIQDGSIVIKDYDYEKQENKIDEIDNNIKEDKKKGKNGLLWVFGIVGVVGIVVCGGSAVNCYVTPFWALLAFKGTAAILSVAIPGGVGALCMLIFIGLLIYRKNVTQKENTILHGGTSLSQINEQNEQIERQIPDHDDKESSKVNNEIQ